MCLNKLHNMLAIVWYKIDDSSNLLNGLCSAYIDLDRIKIQRKELGSLHSVEFVLNDLYFMKTISFIWLCYVCIGTLNQKN